MNDDIVAAVSDSIRAIHKLKEENALIFIENCSRIISSCFKQGGKIIIAGNGGSICDAAHFAEELTGYFREKRKALPAIVLSEPGHLTCVANDLGFDFVFSRGVEAFGKKDDIFIALTTSGNSQNLINAIKCAKKLDLKTICFLGKEGGRLKGLADFEWIVDGFKTSDRIQEAHMAAIHIIIEMIEISFFKEEAKKTLSDALSNIAITS